MTARKNRKLRRIDAQQRRTLDFIAESSLSILSEPHLARMAKNGFKALLPGVESWYDRLHPEDKDRVIASCYAAINSGAGTGASAGLSLRITGLPNAPGSIAWSPDGRSVARVVAVRGAPSDLEPEIVAHTGHTWDAAKPQHPRHGDPNAYHRVQPATDPLAARGAVEAACRAFGGVDIVISNAGTAPSGPTFKARPSVVSTSPGPMSASWGVTATSWKPPIPMPASTRGAASNSTWSPTSRA